MRRPLTEQFGEDEGDRPSRITASTHRNRVVSYQITTPIGSIYLYPWELDDLMAATHTLRRRLRDIGLQEHE